jgi:FkbM family methyltransferase
MANLARYLRNLSLAERNRLWWRSDAGTVTKIGYYPRLAWAYALMAATGRKRIGYLGRSFVFDNPATPLNLQVYPHEMSRQILAHVDDPTSIRTVLDVGGNLGQFAVTAKRFLPEAEIDVFEPNPQVLPYLRENLSGLSGMRIFPYALAPVTTESMFYEPGRSATGSLLAGNAGDADALVEVPIKTSADPTAVTGRSTYDLVKVDVEGSEMDVLRCLRGVSFRYLFIEVSTRTAVKDYRHSELFALLREQFGDFDILCHDRCGSDVRNFDMMLELMETALAASALPAQSSRQDVPVG